MTQKQTHIERTAPQLSGIECQNRMINCDDDAIVNFDDNTDCYYQSLIKIVRRTTLKPVMSKTKVLNHRWDISVPVSGRYFR